MRRLLPRTFLVQLVLGTVLVQAIFLGVFITCVVIVQKKTAQQRTHERIAGQLERISAACAKQLHDEDIDSLHDMLDLASIAQSIQSTRLTDLEGRTLAMSHGSTRANLDAFEQKVLPTAMTQQIFTIANGQFEAVTPVVLNGKAVALLWLEPNPAVSLGTAATVVRVSLTYGFLALLVNFLPIFLLVRSMTRPLRRLTAATRMVIRQTASGAEFPLPVTSSNEAGDLTVSFNTMVRELQEQRSGLLETLALLDSLLENAPIGFAFFDRDQRFVRVNQVLAADHGLPPQQVLGMELAEVFSPAMAAEMGAVIERVFASGEAMRDVEISGEMPSARGVQRTWLCNMYPVRTAVDGVRWVGAIVVEITDRLRAEETLRRTEKLAAAGRLAASVAHEVNNPLESVTNLLYILEHHGCMDPLALEFIHTAQAELARVSHITQQTLRFYRQTVSRTRTDLPEILESIVLLYQLRMTAANVSVVRDYRGNTELLCFGGELRQTFANLIVNAVDAMPRGGTLRLRVRRGTDGGNGSEPRCGVYVVVADTGIGMSQATQAKIFEAFFTTKDATGTGLGLWVSEEIIRKHSGSIRVRSRQGERSGTCFRIFLPEILSSQGADRETKEAAPGTAALS